MANPVGRPKLPETESRHRLLTCRLSLDEERQVDLAARQSGQSRSDWVRAALLAAVGALPQHEVPAPGPMPRPSSVIFAAPEDAFLD